MIQPFRRAFHEDARERRTSEIAVFTISALTSSDSSGSIGYPAGPQK